MSALLLVITNLLWNFCLPVYNSKNKAKGRRRILAPVKKIKFLNYPVSDGKKEKDDARDKEIKRLNLKLPKMNVIFIFIILKYKF
jgi:hypothetical protein